MRRRIAARIRLKRRRQEADLISDLPDELLHQILHHLASTPAAVGTSVLSRRWRRLWADLTELRLDSVLAPVPDIDTVDGALDACCVQTVTRLRISLDHLPPWGSGVSAARVAPWLRFASRPVAGDLCLFLPRAAKGDDADADEDVVLPLCERVTEITLWLGDRFRFRLPAAGTFSVLTYVSIHDARVDGRELEDFVSRRCPRLEELYVRLPPLQAGGDICIRSDSLRWLGFHIEHIRCLKVAVPKLECLSMSNAVRAYITAPDLQEIVWENNIFDPLRHRFVKAGRHLRRLVVALGSPTAALLRRFDTVNELTVDIVIPCGTYEYNAFLENVDTLPNCKVLVVKSTRNSHGAIPSVLHLLRRSTGIEKFVILLGIYGKLVNGLCQLLGCPCDSLESRRTDNINLDSLEEVEINLISDEALSDAQAELVEVLLGCMAPVLKRVVANISCNCPFIREDMCEKIQEMCLLSNRFEFSALSAEEWEESCSTVVIHISVKRQSAVELLTFADLLEYEISHVR